MDLVRRVEEVLALFLCLVCLPAILPAFFFVVVSDCLDPMPKFSVRNPRKVLAMLCCLAGFPFLLLISPLLVLIYYLTPEELEEGDFLFD